MPISILRADLVDPAHQRAVLELLDAYARDPMGDSKPLAADVRERLIPGLRTHPTTMIWLAYEETRPVGIAVCFLGFSTFQAKPLINIHDLAVLPEVRGQGVGSRLLAAVEQTAREMGCCKLTLEVLTNNHVARTTYTRAGFAPATYDPAAGEALFFAKSLR